MSMFRDHLRAAVAGAGKFKAMHESWTTVRKECALGVCDEADYWEKMAHAATKEAKEWKALARKIERERAALEKAMATVVGRVER